MKQLPETRVVFSAVAIVAKGVYILFCTPSIDCACRWKLRDIDVIELNEAFAAQALAVIQEAGLDPDRVNPNGGAIALGHPLGCTGVKLTATIIRELQRRNGRYGLVTMCVGGGMGAAGIFENLQAAGADEKA